jgi:hypothetical protein
MKISKAKILLIPAMTFLSTVSFAQIATPPAIPAGLAPASWSDYCRMEGSSPVGNMKNVDVKEAHKVLTMVENHKVDKKKGSFSYYFYAGPVKAHGLKKGVDNNPDLFISLLCGEFKDRPTMIREKLQWVHRLYLLPKTQQTIIDVKKPLWSQVSAHSYQPYLQYSADLWQSRFNGISKVQLGNYSVDEPVLGQLMCETKMIFVNYVSRGKSFTSLVDHEADFAKFSKVPGNCTKEEMDNYYDFRGDSNFKPNSPESNGMIWYSSAITSNCEVSRKAKAGQKGPKILTDENCKAYFEAPFASRWSAARAGLGTWILRSKEADSVFASEGSATTILSAPDFSKPFEYDIGSGPSSKLIEGWNLASWSLGDMGFNKLIGLSAGALDLGLAYERLRDAVNRHTDWYSSGFDDRNGMAKSEAYSPFVASSYEMSQSDQFTAPGVTVNSPADGFKHWMFVFKVHKNNWYNTHSLRDRKPVNFDFQWFDETSFGTNHLAKKERAWDRLGSPLEGEYDSILYLHNIHQHGVVAD